MTCENCFSSCEFRFCTKKCARAFSTKEKRKEINQKVSQKLRKIHINVNLDELRHVIHNSKSWKEVQNFFKLSLSKTNRNRLREISITHQIDFSHFKQKRSVEHVLSHRPNQNKGSLRVNLIKIGRLYECEICKQKPEWQNKSLTLQIDHINGNKFDHRSENLRFLCPNCHSQTSTFSGRNMKNHSPLD